jgi:hypothetical protein
MSDPSLGIIKSTGSWVPVATPIILATQEAKIRRLTI